MYCFFKTTTTTKRSLFELKSVNLQLYPNELQVLQDADDLRNKIIQGNFQVIPQYLQLFLNNLKPILNKQPLFHPSFTYEPMVSNCQLKSPQDCQEAFETDYVMLIYSYCCGQLFDSLQQIKNIRQAIIENKLPNTNDIDIVLQKMKTSYAFIKHIKNDSQQLLPKLSQKKNFDVEEFSSQFFIRYSIYFIIMTNLIHYEKFQQMNQEQELINRQNLCSTMYKLLISIGNLGTDRLGIYLTYLSIYLKCLGYKSIMDRYLYCIQKEYYKEKSFTVMILELIQLGQELKQICTIIINKQLNEDYLDIFKIQAQRWIAFSDVQIRVHSGIARNPQPILTNEQILLNLGYYNCLD
ncbi:unnamed protein product [Paramecium pentaurelia]|uniref:Uncharacterized protein n=1 Tax=Paramecium pentaurelia TaxID=43138 RepID=A0A8S1XZY2_9CILI|nr:unnamed protein product [Paramecium pentaurelia]